MPLLTGLLVIPLVILSVVVTYQVHSSLKLNMMLLKESLDLRADANKLLPLLLIQDDATKAILINPGKLEAYSGRKIEAYDEHHRLLDGLLASARSQDIHELVLRLKKIDGDSLRPVDSEVLELLFDDPDQARRVYFKKYDPFRNEYEKTTRELVSILTLYADQLTEQLQAENQTLTRKIAGTLGFGAFGLALVVGSLFRVIRQRGAFLAGEVAKRTLELTNANRNLRLEMEARERAVQEREQIRIAMLSSAKMAALGEMAGGIAHEINNPLAIISGRASQVERLLRFESPPLERVREAAAVIGPTTERISRIIQGLKAFCRQGDHDPFESTSVSEIIQDTLSLCSEKLKTKGVSLECQFPDPAPELACRPTQIGQALLNLINNAADAVETQGERWIRIAVTTDEGSIEISVENSGPLIPAPVQEKLFQPFFTTKEIGQGTGLGLSISKGLVEDQGGKIWLDDKSLRTRFVISMPKAGGSLRTTA